MTANWTFGRKIGAGFGTMLVLCLFIAIVAGFGLRTVVAGGERLIEVNAQNLIDAEQLEGSAELELENLRDYLLTNDAHHLDAMQRARLEFDAEVRQLRPRLSSEAARALDDIQRASDALDRSAAAVIALRKGGARLDDVAAAFQKDVAPSLEAMRRAQDALVALENRELDQAKAEAAAAARHAMMLVGVIGSIALLTAVVLGFVLSRSLSREVGSAIHHVQSSSAELQAAATQQASASTEQAAAMTEIMTTIKELLATSHQIAESAQRVARIADQTTSAARSGDITVQTAQDALMGIKRQVDLIVTHMLELGKKSQQIGGILEIINELAEQTNILAINATIEAAGAGETGRRFGVVADEIRKLADRVGGSTKDIRVLIEEIRSAVNSTVMVTEAGTKAVDAGAKQFGEVKASLHQIMGMVSTTTEATREIELSTKQQTTAVEQVNLAAANVTQAARETEASSTQTLQTASQLATLSKGLTRLIQAQASA